MKICSRQGKFGLMSIKHSATSGGIIGILFLIFYNLKVFCVFSLESPHWGDSNEYTQHTIINIKKKIILNYPKYNNVCSYGTFPQEQVWNSHQCSSTVYTKVNGYTFRRNNSAISLLPLFFTGINLWKKRSCSSRSNYLPSAINSF